MARPRHRKGSVPTPDRLLRAAEAEFAARGYASARLEDIARRVGIRRPSLLHHFPSKQALYAAVVRHSFSRLGERLGSARGVEGAFRARLRALVEAFCGFVAARPATARLVVRELVEESGPGRALLAREAGALLDEMSRFVARDGAGELAQDVPVRAALMQVASDALLRAAAGRLRGTLWGPERASWLLARRLLLARPGDAA